MQKRKLGVDPSGRAGLQLHFSFAGTHLALTATTHEVERQRTLTQLLLEIYMMTGFGILDKDDQLTVKGAAVQDVRAGGGDQAAHYLPRQLMVNAISLQDVAVKYSTVLSNHIKALFARTEHLPANYNRADSKAEMQGLHEAFRQSCRAVLKASNPLTTGHTSNDAVENAPTFIKSAINIYQIYAKTAFYDALKGLEEKLNGESVFTTERERWTMQSEIIRNYLKVTGIHQSVNEELTSEHIESAFHTYARIMNP